MGSLAQMFNEAKPFLALIFIQFGYAWMSIIAKLALNHGMSQNVFVVYRMVVASALVAPSAFVLERKSRPKMTLSIFTKIMLLSFLEPVLEQNLYYTGMKHTTATFTAAMCNILPALTFLMACIFGLEKVYIRRLHSQAKVVGTVVAVGGAMLMTLIKGPVLKLPWTDGKNHHNQSGNVVDKQDFIKGAVMITAGCFSWASYMILQAFILKSYPAQLSLTALICMMGMVEGAILTLIVERGNTSVWFVHFDIKLLAALYGGMVSGIAYFIMGLLVKQKGPVFVSAFNPLSMVIIAIIGSFVLREEMSLGRVIGAVVIVVGLYLVLWGKSKDQPTSKTEGDEKEPNNQQMATMTCNVENPGPEFIGVNSSRV